MSWLALLLYQTSWDSCTHRKSPFCTVDRFVVNIKEFELCFDLISDK